MYFDTFKEQKYKQNVFRVMMRINVTWNDRRVDFLNLRDDIYQNLVPEDEASKMWIPEIGILFQFEFSCQNLKLYSPWYLQNCIYDNHCDFCDISLVTFVTSMPFVPFVTLVTFVTLMTFVTLVTFVTIVTIVTIMTFVHL